MRKIQIDPVGIEAFLNKGIIVEAPEKATIARVLDRLYERFPSLGDRGSEEFILGFNLETKFTNPHRSLVDSYFEELNATEKNALTSHNGQVRVVFASRRNFGAKSPLLSTREGQEDDDTDDVLVSPVGNSSNAALRRLAARKAQLYKERREKSMNFGKEWIEVRVEPTEEERKYMDNPKRAIEDLATLFPSSPRSMASSSSYPTSPRSTSSEGERTPPTTSRLSTGSPTAAVAELSALFGGSSELGNDKDADVTEDGSEESDEEVSEEFEEITEDGVDEGSKDEKKTDVTTADNAKTTDEELNDSAHKRNQSRESGGSNGSEKSSKRSYLRQKSNGIQRIQLTGGQRHRGGKESRRMRHLRSESEGPEDWKMRESRRTASVTPIKNSGAPSVKQLPEAHSPLAKLKRSSRKKADDVNNEISEEEMAKYGDVINMKLSLRRRQRQQREGRRNRNLPHCFLCDLVIPPGDRFIVHEEYKIHASCFCCVHCQKSLEGQPYLFVAENFWDVPHWTQCQNASLAMQQSIISVSRVKHGKVKMGKQEEFFQKMKAEEEEWEKEERKKIFWELKAENYEDEDEDEDEDLEEEEEPFAHRRAPNGSPRNLHL